MYVLKQNGRHSEEKDRENACRYLKMEERELVHTHIALSRKG